MAGTKNRQDIESKRLLNIDWRGDSTETDTVAAPEQTGEAAQSVAVHQAAFPVAPVEDTDVEPCLIPDRSIDLSAIEPSSDAAAASLRIDEIFNHIAPYRAVIDNKVPVASLLGRSLLAQANAIFNTAFLNLQARYGYADIYVDSPLHDPAAAQLDDITQIAVHEVLRLQRLV